MSKKVVIIGAGPAGLTAGYLLAKKGVGVQVVEADARYVGGISRTVEYKGFHFDIGGHRFFSKSKAVEDLWTELLPRDLLERPRSSRIYYRGRFFSYPLKAADALVKLGLIESFLCVASYFHARLSPVRDPRNFEDWVSNQFGRRLFRIFFKTYTEKVWGMDCREISADWAAQRIKGLSLGRAILQSLGLRSNRGSGDQVIKTLIDSFRYPRKGPGMMWEAAARRIREMGGEILMGRKVGGLDYDADRRIYRVTYQDGQGTSTTIEADHVISSAPMRELVRGLTPPLGDKAKRAAERLRYRDFLVVALMLRDRNLFDDNWIYIHDPNVKVGRIQNFKSWSPEMVPDPALCCYGLEYFCFEGDGLWSSPDERLIAQAAAELEKLGLAARADVLDGCVVRMPKAYPVYDDEYAANVSVIRGELERAHPRLHLTGRNGMHKYNNQDHAMMTAMLTVENILADRQVYDVWRVNEDAEYHEAGHAGAQTEIGGERLVPARLNQSA
ncbi:MAG TPA: NAD(P)/FAD-dependent oxidoreductase [Blastocatellia bacterium]|nr:NAD(P)/FAD-dependent oxidoreductase [Blastocatellia bacterium]